MERGETAKQMAMVEGSFGYESGTPVSSLASPLPYKIGFPYKISIKGSALHTQNIITVTSRAGAPVEGAGIDFTDTSGPQTYVRVIADGSKVYAKADPSSAVLLNVEKKTRGCSPQQAVLPDSSRYICRMAARRGTSQPQMWSRVILPQE
ncbi:hypothetical protein ACFSQ7_36995 [Paenibacillus rhizoplanae]